MTFLKSRRAAALRPRRTLLCQLVLGALVCLGCGDDEGSNAPKDAGPDAETQLNTTDVDGSVPDSGASGAGGKGSSTQTGESGGKGGAGGNGNGGAGGMVTAGDGGGGMGGGPSGMGGSGGAGGMAGGAPVTGGSGGEQAGAGGRAGEGGAGGNAGEGGAEAPSGVCEDNPCMHSGTCTVDAEGLAQCDCSGTGYEGPRCEDEIDECAPSPCMNGGTCVDQVGGYRCDCAAGYEGERCQDEIDECAPSPCMNGGTCIDEVGGYRCECPEGYEGDRCETGGGGCTLSNDTCTNGTYCAFNAEANCGNEGAAGTCKPIPENCITIYTPVCGCDGVTYSNDCFAGMASVSIARTGECETTSPPPPDGPDGPDGPSTQGCQYLDTAHEIGTQFPAGDDCNTCECREGGSVVCTEADCGSGAQCTSNTACTLNEYCHFDTLLDACGSNNAWGKCSSRPKACTGPVAAVCGCDGNSYESACAAALSGSSVASNGACTISRRP